MWYWFSETCIMFLTGLRHACLGTRVFCRKMMYASTPLTILPVRDIQVELELLQGKFVLGKIIL